MPDEPAVKYAMGFFDAQNLYQHAKDAFGHHHPNFDPLKLHGAVCADKGWKANAVRFYTGVPSPAESPMWHGYWAKRILALKRAGVITVTRPLRYRKEKFIQLDGTEKIITTPQEKGIDVRLAVDLISAARTSQFDIAVIYSQDQDLCEVLDEVKAISKAQDRWIRVACAFPSGPKATARRGIDKTDWIPLTEEFYNNCLDPHDYRPAKT